jgi:uncharacterized protein (DUF2252 family)
VADVVARIKKFNRGRDAQLLRRKYAEMRDGAFRFYRGTCHLFYEDWSSKPPIADTPLAWVSGDLHPENFGSFRGRDGIVYFDVNDFDEAALGPCVWDVARCMTGIRVGTAELGILEDDLAYLGRRYLYAYCTSLGTGSAGVVDDVDSSGMVRELLRGVATRPAETVVDARTTGRRKRRRIIIDGVHSSRASRSDREQAVRLIESFNATLRKRSRYEILDVANRIAGTGSLGVARYVVLAQRKRSLTLIDCKMEPRASLAPYLTTRQPVWRCDAERVTAVQELTQTSSPSPLAAIVDGEASFVVKELQPFADRVRWEHWHGRLERLENLMSAMGQVTAWSHLRGAARRGAAKKSELAAFAKDRTWPGIIAEYSRAYAVTVQHDYERFVRAYDAGRVKAGEG